MADTFQFELVAPEKLIYSDDIEFVVVPGADGDFVDDINPDSLEVLSGCKLEPSLDQVPAGTAIQFERTGYFVTDPDGTPDAPVYNRTVALRDSWAKAKAKG